MSLTLPPLLPKIDAILILDGDGNRLAGKYYGSFLTAPRGNGSPETSSLQDLRSQFEQTLYSKIQGISARPDAAEVVTVQGKTAVFCGGSGMAPSVAATNGNGHPSSPSNGGSSSGAGDVRVVHIGPSSESELVLAYLCEGVYDALSQLMGGQTDRTMVLDNLELVFLLLDEHCDGGLILEVDGSKLACSVLLRDEEPQDPTTMEGMAAAAAGSMPGFNGGGVNAASRAAAGIMQGGGGDITLAQAFRQAKEQLIAGLNQNGM